MHSVDNSGIPSIQDNRLSGFHAWFDQEAVCRQPGRFGLRDTERDVLAEWLAPGTVVAVMNPGEKELFQRLQQLTAGRPVMLSPKMRVLDAIDQERTEGRTGSPSLRSDMHARPPEKRANLTGEVKISSHLGKIDPSGQICTLIARPTLHI